MSVFVLLAVSAAAPADVVYLKDGTAREGRVISQNDDVVVLEVAATGAKARMTINRNDIDRIEVKATDQEVLEDEYKTRLAKLDRANADAVLALAKWCMSKKLFKEGELLLTGLAAQGGDNVIRANLALANMEYDRKRFDVARGYLKAVLDKQPGNLDAKLLMDMMAEGERDAAARLLVDAIQFYNHEKFEQALKKAESFHNAATPEQSKLLLGKTDFPEGMKFDEFVAEARLHAPCTFCKQGSRVCPACKGKGELADAEVCGECGATGSVVCEHCGGTGVKFSDIPDWELPGVARALEQRASRDAAELKKTAMSLAGSPKDAEIIPAAFKAQLLAARALRWLDHLEAIGKKKTDVTLRSFTKDREEVQKEFQGLCIHLGELFGKRAQETWTRAEAAEAGLLSQDKLVREARDDLARAVSFYGHTRLRQKDPYPSSVVGTVDTLQALLAKLEKVVKHNVKLVKAYELALKNFRRDNLGGTLALLVDLVNNAAKRDLEYLSARTTRELNGTLPEWMAGCRFELGKEKGEFGETTEYERAAFVKKLLTEADGTAAQADANYQKMLGMRDAGRRNMVPTSLVRNTREFAEAARRYYRAALAVPYPLSGDKRQQINDQIDYMSKIISQCKQWYITGTPTPTPVPGH
jgi:hypothetical protein